VNLSVNETIKPVEGLNQKKFTPFTLVTLAIILVYLPYKYGLGNNPEDLGQAILIQASSYLLAIFLFRAIAQIVSEGRIYLVLGAAVIGVVAGGMMGNDQQISFILGEWFAIVGSGLIISRMNRKAGSFRIYLAGLVIVVSGSLIMMSGEIVKMMEIAALNSKEIIANFENEARLQGFSGQAVDELIMIMRKALEASVRLMPASITMNLVMQFSIGFLWLGIRGTLGRTRLYLAPFTSWKMPFAVMPAIIVIVSLRLMSGDTIALIADNILASLSIFYCVTGLSLIEHFLNRIKLPLIAKILFYIMYAFTYIIGYFIAVALGFIDSFADWRKISSPPNNLKKMSE